MMPSPSSMFLFLLWTPAFLSVALSFPKTPVPRQRRVYTSRRLIAAEYSANDRLFFSPAPLSDKCFRGSRSSSLTPSAIYATVPRRNDGKRDGSRNSSGRREGSRQNQQQSSSGRHDDPFGDYEDDFDDEQSQLFGNHGYESSFSDSSRESYGYAYDNADCDDGMMTISEQSVSSNSRGRNHRYHSGDGRKTRTETAISAEIPQSHFYSKKSLKDPSFFTADNTTLQGTFQRLCEGVGITRPSRIQSLAWPILLRGKHAIVADQTGSGKTLAYLMPLVQRMMVVRRDDHHRHGRSHARNINGAPRILILAPTAELADQIKAVCDNLARRVPFRTMVITATGNHATNIRDQIRLLQRQPVDIIVSTPGRISTILRSKNSGGLDLTELQSLVLDEVDILLIDETFGPQIRTVGVATPSADRTQFVFVTATLPDSVVRTVEREFPHVEKIRGPGLHRVAPTVKEHLIDVSVPSTSNRDTDLCFEMKSKQLLKSLRTHRCSRTLVFCNTVETCRNVENLLKRTDRRGRRFNVGAYHNAITPEARNRNLAIFARAGTNGRDVNGRRGRKDYKDTNKRDHDDVDQILVCTDRAARGVDFDAAPVDHVILFDFPSDPAEYVRRVGRTARAGRQGTSTIFAYGWQLPIARRIMGSKLESFSIAADELDGDVDEEYRGGVQGRKRRGGKNEHRKEKDAMIKGNIEGGKLWNDGK